MIKYAYSHSEVGPWSEMYDSRFTAIEAAKKALSSTNFTIGEMKICGYPTVNPKPIVRKLSDIVCDDFAIDNWLIDVTEEQYKLLQTYLDHIVAQWVTSIGQERTFFEVISTEQYNANESINATAKDVNDLLDSLEKNQELRGRSVDQWRLDNQNIMDSIKEALKYLIDYPNGYDSAREFLNSTDVSKQEMALGYLKDVMNLQLEVRTRDDALADALQQLEK